MVGQRRRTIEEEEMTMGETRMLEATASKEGKWWNIAIPELDQVTATKKMADVQDYATSLSAVVLDVPEEDVNVRVTFSLPEEVEAAWQAARDETRRARELTMSAAARTRTVVRALHDDGCTVREIGILLDISNQRVSQIIRGK